MIASVHIHVKTGVSADTVEIIVTSFTEKEILDAKTELIELLGLGMAKPGGHKDTAERSAAFLYAKELVALVYELDKEKKMPKVVVASDQLGRVPLGMKGLSPADAVPISTRMNDLENTVKNLCDSFEKFRKENQTKPVEKTFASIAASNLGTGARFRGQGHGVAPTIQVTEPPFQGSWAAEMEGQSAGGTPSGQTGGQLSAGHGQLGGQVGRGYHGEGLYRGRSASPKRSRDDLENSGQREGQFQPVLPRRPRKVTYGNSKVTMEGAEAAPVEIFIGNTNPKATPDIIEKVMKKCAINLPEKIDLEVLDVKRLARLDLDPNPRTKCWKITVPYRFKEVMARDDLYYCGWSHRQFYPPKQNRAKRHHPDPNDPVAEHLNGGGEGGGDQGQHGGA